MKFFRKSESKEPTEPVPVQSSPTPVTEVRVELPAKREPESVDDAKAMIAELKLRKKDLQGEKKDVQAEQSEVRAGHAEKRAGRYVMPRGGGTIGKMMRAGVQSSRRNDRMSMQAEIQGYNDAKAKIDADILVVDRDILLLDKYVKANAPATTPRAAAPKPLPVNEISDRLRALTEMKDAGLLTDDEYNAKRAELVARL